MAKRKSRFPSYGLVRGASHAQGGVAGVVAGEQPVELEGGEWIVPKEAVPDYLPVLKQITNEGRAMQEMQNGNSAMDALIASASMQNGITQPKSPMYQHGGAVSDKTRVGMSEYIPELSYDLPTFDGKTKQPQYGMSNMPMSQEEMMQVVMDVGIPGAAIGSIGKKASRAVRGLRNQYGEYIRDPLANRSKKELMRMIKEPVQGDVSVFDLLDDTIRGDLKHFKAEDIADIIRESFPNKDVSDYFTAGRKYPTGGPVNYYQDGGQVGGRAPITDKQLIDGKYRVQTIMPVPADLVGGDEGLRYYLSAPQVSDRLSMAELAAGLSARRKMAETPADSLPAALVEGYFDRQNKKSPLDFLKKLIGKHQQGGPINQYQQGGQIQPRKQQEMRNPEVYGPPVPADIDSLLNQIMMRDVNQSINPFSGDSLNFEEDSLRLLGKMKKSHMPTYGRKKMQQGGPVMYQQGGLVGEGQPLERRYGEAAGGESPGGYFPLASQAEPGALMGSIRSDRRIKPLQPDTYIQKIPLAKPFDESSLAHPFYQEEVEQVPKLSTAYLASFGMETPLSRKQGALLYRKGIAPQTLNPQVKGLINRALVQRLTNEDD